MKKTTAEVNANYLANLFEEKANEILEKEKKATKKKATKKAETVAKAEITEKAEKPKTVKKATKKSTEKVVKDGEKITKKPAKKVVKKAEKPAEEQAEKPKKVEKVEQEQELRKISKSLKIAKSTYKVVSDITNYDELLKAVESEREISVAFDCSEVSKTDYENIFHVPYVNMKDDFDVCEPVFIGDKVPRLVFASIYSEALWDLFPEEFDLVSAVLEK